MYEQTHLASALDAMDETQLKCDTNIKELLANIQVLARIVKHTVKEVRNLSIPEIMECINANDISVGRNIVEPGHGDRKVESIQTEDTMVKEGYIRYDIRFSLVYGGEKYKVIINVEAQKSMNASKLGYHLESRIVFYLCRLISAQKNVDFFHSEYDNIRKVYSIWICMDTGEDEDSITKISLKQETVFGKSCDLPHLDKMCGYIIRIRENDDVEESKNHLIAMLEDLLRKEPADIKKRKLECVYGMEMNVELEGKVNQMCNISGVYFEQGYHKGMTKGEAKNFLENILSIQNTQACSLEKALEMLGKTFSYYEEMLKIAQSEN